VWLFPLSLGMIVVTLIIAVIAVLQLLYSWTMRRRAVLK
jgi:hypothetical protein